jgi:glutathione S-transferase
MMIKLYAIPVSLYCAKLRILLRHKQLDWEEILPQGGYGSAEYKKVVASGNLPAIIDDGMMIADSEAIAEYLNEKYPHPPMLPEQLKLRAMARERSRFHDTRLEPELRLLFPHIAPEKRDQKAIIEQSRKISARLKQFSQMLLGSRSLDDELNLGDCGFPISFVWLEELAPILGLTIVWPTEVHRYREQINQIPAVKEGKKSYRPLLSTYLKQQIAK